MALDACGRRPLRELGEHRVVAEDADASGACRRDEALSGQST
jgi:hypothetical protein